MSDSPTVDFAERTDLWYYLSENTQPVGPLSYRALQALSKEGIITPATLIARSGADKWHDSARLFPREKKLGAGLLKLNSYLFGGPRRVLFTILIIATLEHCLIWSNVLKASRNNHSGPTDTTSSAAPVAVPNIVFFNPSTFRSVNNTQVGTFSDLLQCVSDGSVSIKEASHYAFPPNSISALLEDVLDDYLIFKTNGMDGNTYQFAMKRDPAFEAKYPNYEDIYYGLEHGAFGVSPLYTGNGVVIDGFQQFTTDGGFVRMLPTVRVMTLPTQAAPQ